MKVSLNWLREFVNFRMEEKKVASLLNGKTMEVKKILPYYLQKKSFKNIIVGEIKDISVHPSSDKFGIAEVYCGEAVGIKRIVFTKAGLDIKIGEKPMIATKGAIFEDGLKIRDKAIFGIVSEAAFCSEKDLGLPLNISSIVKFPLEELGATAYDIFELNDTVLEFDLEPNRPDLFGIMGFAYELSAILDKDIILPELYNEIEFIPGRNYSSKENELTVNVENKGLIPSYIAVKISGIEIKESSMDIKNRLIKSGIRPVNNIVDLTNIVMIETSQPLHAFDAGKISGDIISARSAVDGESVVTLDGKERKLTKDDMVIADENKIVALAGVMGAADSEIDTDTTTLIVESANFNMSNIRRTSRRLSIRTDASTRFEKGISPYLSLFGIKRFLYLLSKYVGVPSVSCYAYDIADAGKPDVYEIDLKDLCDFLGDTAVASKACGFLKRLGYEITDDKPKNVESEALQSIKVSPPYFRSDISENINIYEDVFRIYGYDNIKSSMPVGILTPPQKNLGYETSKHFRNLLRCVGFTEIVTPSLVGKRDIALSGAGDAGVLALKNPVSIDRSFFRISLIPDIINILSQNSKKHKNIKIFEIGKIYLDERHDGDYPVLEKDVLCGAICSGIKYGKQDTEFYYGKGIIEFLFKESGIKKITYSKISDDLIFDEDVSLEVLIGKNRVGIFGEIKKGFLEEFKLDYRVFVFNLDMDYIKDFISFKRSFVQPGKYPEIEQDISIIVDSGIEYASIEKHIKGFSKLIKNVKLADVYRGKQIKEGKISFLIRYDAISPNRTLTMEEVNLLRDNLIKELNDRFGVTLRD